MKSSRLERGASSSSIWRPRFAVGWRRGSSDEGERGCLDILGAANDALVWRWAVWA